MSYHGANIATYELPQYETCGPEEMQYENLGLDSMSEDDRETFNMQCNIALLSLMNKPKQSRNGMMCSQGSHSQDSTEYANFSCDTLSGLNPSPLSSTTTSPDTSPQTVHPPQDPFAQYRNQTGASAYQHKRVAELTKAPRNKDSSNGTASGSQKRKMTSAFSGVESGSKHVKRK